MFTPLDALESLKQQAWRRRACRVEALESRRLLSITLDGQTLRITGTGGADEISLTRTGSDDVIARENATTRQFDLDDINEVVISGGAGNDVIFASANGLSDRGIDIRLDGGPGNDRIEGADNDDAMFGGDGNDTLVALDGNDTLDGGGGTDTLLGGEGFNIHINGETNSGAALPGLSLDGSTLRFDGSGQNDTLVAWRRLNGDLAVWINGRQQNVSGVTAFRAFGHGGNDSLRLEASVFSPATLNGGTGNDHLGGGGGANLLVGDFGDDSLLGNGGNDTLDGGLGADTMFGGAGRDTADYSSRTGDLFIAQNESSTGLGRGGEADEDDVLALDVERVLGGSGDDRFNGGDGPNTYFGGDGNDTISGFGAADALHGQGGNDVIIGGFGNDFLDGGSGNDDVYGQVGNDTLLGQAGNDRLFANDNARDTVNGGSGTDTGTTDNLDLVTSIETSS